jgi:hypothetical protein
MYSFAVQFVSVGMTRNCSRKNLRRKMHRRGTLYHAI